ncbi:MAG: OFA family MFS transporter [Bacilli bacterium]|nr:OFA family MFS transporter [Bacilli bacterium]
MELLKKRWIYVVNGVVILLFMGCSYAWSVFVVPLEYSYGWSRSETSLAFTLNLIFFSIGSIMVGIFSKKLSFSTILKIAAVMISIGFFTSSFVERVELIYLTYSFLCGCGIGAGYSCVISSAPLWFPEKSGMITGILLMGYALSTAIFSPIINSLIQLLGISYTFKILALISFIGLILGSFLLKIPTHEESSQLPQESRPHNNRTNNINTSQMIKKPLFWNYYILSAFNAGIGLTIINHVTPMLKEDLFISSALASIVVSIISICNGGGRIIWGMVFDRQGIKKTLSYINIVMLCSSFLLTFSLSIKNQYLFIFAASILLFVFGGNASLMPTIVRYLFGCDNFSLNYSILSTSCIIQASLPTIVGTIHTMTSNYFIPTKILLIISILNILLLFIMIKLYNREY